MIRLLLNCYTEREKLLLLQALTEAGKYLADRGIHVENAPHLVYDITHAVQFTSSEHVHDVVARTLGIDTRAEREKPDALRAAPEYKKALDEVRGWRRDCTHTISLARVPKSRRPAFSLALTDAVKLGLIKRVPSVFGYESRTETTYERTEVQA